MCNLPCIHFLALPSHRGFYSNYVGDRGHSFRLYATRHFLHCLLTWSLIALSFIDIDHYLLPDSITLPLLWLGLLLSLFNLYTDAHASIIGAVAGYTVLWLVYKLFKLITGKEGMGYGDFKLLALFGAWIGWQYLPLIILLSSLVGAVIGITMIAVVKQDHNKPIPFGPYLAAAGWIAIVMGRKNQPVVFNSHRPLNSLAGFFMLKIGLTGGIGCGKTSVARLFAELDIPVIDADEIAHQLVEKGQPALQRIAQVFGSTILKEDGTLNRSQLKDLIFSDSGLKQKLEGILHPLIYQSIQSTIENLDASYCIVCIPLLIETDRIDNVDRVLIVDCPVETQIERVQNRDHLSMEKIQAILENQVSRAVRLSKADDVIDNSEIETGLAEQVKKLHNLYLSISTAGLTRP